MLQITCLTCGPCKEPEPIPGFDVIVQSVAISDTQVAVQLQNSVFFAGAQFQTFCTLGSDSTALHTSRQFYK